VDLDYHCDLAIANGQGAPVMNAHAAMLITLLALVAMLLDWFPNETDDGQ
jgi:hypothetical protein